MPSEPGPSNQGPSDLGPAQVRLLGRLAAGDEPAVARRAAIVLAEHRRRAARGERRRGAGHPGDPAAGPAADDAAGPAASRPTAAKWYARFAEAGAGGLRDLPRSGRPPAHGDDAVRSVLVAPLYAPSVRWTSHTVAGLTGRSQSAVVRTWRDVFERADAALPALPGGLDLVGVRLDATGSLLVLAERGAAAPPGPAGPFMRSPRRPPLQVLLAADLVAAGAGLAAGANGADGADGADGAGAFVEQVARRTGTRYPLHVLRRGSPVAPPAGGSASVLPSAQWQGLLDVLVRRCTATPQPHLVALQQRLMAWARDEPAPFEWGPEEPRGRPGASRAPRAEPRPTGQVVADAVLDTIVDRIGAGRLAAGDRVTESSLSRAVHASRGHVREALLTLAADGLVDLEPHRGARVPAPQVADVVETYAARRALGALVVRRAAQWAPGALDPVEQALAALAEAGAGGDARATGDADIRFQDALALSTGMRRIPQMFLALSAQIRLFTAVMGVRYAYSIPAMVRDDTALLEHVRARDETAALRAWHTKMDDALGYMVTQLGAPQPRRRA